MTVWFMINIIMSSYLKEINAKILKVHITISIKIKAKIIRDKKIEKIILDNNKTLLENPPKIERIQSKRRNNIPNMIER